MFFNDFKVNMTTTKLRASLRLVVATMTVLEPFLCGAASAQFNEADMVDSFAPAEASPADFHNEKFKEAELALTQGLARSIAPGAQERKQPNLRQVSAVSSPKIKPEVNENRHGVPVITDGLGVTNTQIDLDDFADTSRMKAEKTERIAKVSKPVAPIQAKPDVKPQVQVVQNKNSEQEKEISDLRRELAEARSSLAAAELEISRLSSIIQDSSRARLNIKESPALSQQKKPVQSETVARINSRPQVPQNTALASGQDLGSDLQVAMVSVDKADLRLGPGRNHSALMSLRRGSRLAVEARQGEWYRVFAPNGQRAWIHSALVKFGDGAASMNDGSSVKVKGYDSGIR
jgi:hypothetical protein